MTGSRSQLLWLARQWDGLLPGVREADLVAFACPTLSSTELERRWEELRHDLALLDGLEHRPGAAETTYRDIDEELTSPDRHTDAIEIAAARVDADLGLLSGGVI